MQHNRTEAFGSYLPPQTDLGGIEHVILNRDSRALPLVRGLLPEARFYLWVHDQLNPGSKRGRRWPRPPGSCASWASRWSAYPIHSAAGSRRPCGGCGVQDRVRALTIYNPVDDALSPDGSPFDDRKLVFFSSPNKGLAYTLDAFRALRRRMPDLKLRVGNPGYKVRKPARIDGVEYLGPQPQERIHAEVRTALCTFFPEFRPARDLRSGVRRIQGSWNTGSHARLRRSGGGGRRLSAGAAGHDRTTRLRGRISSYLPWLARRPIEAGGPARTVRPLCSASACVARGQPPNACARPAFPAHRSREPWRALLGIPA